MNKIDLVYSTWFSQLWSVEADDSELESEPVDDR